MTAHIILLIVQILTIITITMAFAMVGKSVRMADRLATLRRNPDLYFDRYVIPQMKRDQRRKVRRYLIRRRFRRVRRSFSTAVMSMVGIQKHIG